MAPTAAHQLEAAGWDGCEFPAPKVCRRLLDEHQAAADSTTREAYDFARITAYCAAAVGLTAGPDRMAAAFDAGLDAGWTHHALDHAPDAWFAHVILEDARRAEPPVLVTVRRRADVWRDRTWAPRVFAAVAQHAEEFPELERETTTLVGLGNLAAEFEPTPMPAYFIEALLVWADVAAQGTRVDVSALCAAAAQPSAHPSCAPR